MVNSDGGVRPTPGPPASPIAKKQARKRKRARARRQRRRQANQMLYDPSAPLSGRSLRRVAGATARKEFKPQIDAQKTAIRTSRQEQKYDVRGLNKMGKRLDQSMAGLVGRLGGYQAESINRATQARDTMNQNLANTAKQSQDRLNSLQGQVLGDQISSLQAAGVQPGQSATDKAMGRLSESQQQAQANQSQSWSNLAAVLGETGVTNASAMGDAAVYGAESDRSAIERNIASRIEDRKQVGATERSKSRSELATIRSLRGASKVKNIMDLRREQQDYGARMAEIQAQAQQWNAENTRKWYDSETGRIRANKSGSGSKSGPGDTPRKMTKGEWKDWKSVGVEIVNSQPKKKITNWNAFLNEVASTKGVKMTARERRQYKKRFKKWYRKNR